MPPSQRHIIYRSHALSKPNPIHHPDSLLSPCNSSSLVKGVQIMAGREEEVEEKAAAKYSALANTR